MTRNGLAAHLTASHGPGPPRHQHRTPTRTGPTTTGPRSPWTISSDARPGSDSRTNATHKGSDHFGPGTIGIRVSSSPSRPGHHWPGPSTSSTSGQVGPRADPLISSRSGIPLIRVSSFPQIPPLASHSFFPYNCHKRDFLLALQTLHVCWLHADICSIISTPTTPVDLLRPKPSALTTSNCVV